MHNFDTPAAPLRNISGYNFPSLPNPNTKAIVPFLPTTILTSPILPLIRFADNAFEIPLPNSRLTPWS